MWVKLPATIRENRTLQVLLAASVTILLGAIGSGLWELILARLFEAIANAFLTTLSRVFHGYVDILHRNIGKGPSGQLEVSPYVMRTIVFVSVPWIAFFYFMSSIRILRRRIVRADDGQQDDFTPETLLARLDRLRKLTL